jgi:carbon-monoxide dehydrogenase small subunit
MPAVSLTVNGKPVKATVEPRTLLVQLLREQLRLTGTHVGCDTSQCGCCVVHVDGKAIKSCTMLALQADGADVLTIEGLATADKLEGNICRCTGYHNIVKSIAAGAKAMKGGAPSHQAAE